MTQLDSEDRGADILNKYPSPSGSQYSAAQQTLQYLLQLAVDGCTDKAIMVAAVESSPAVFAAVLGYQPTPLVSLGRWHEHINAASLRVLIPLLLRYPPVMNVCWSVAVANLWLRVIHPA